MLTRKQSELLEYLTTHLSMNDVPPSFDEMRDALGLASKSGIHRLVSGLEERGYIRRLPNRARAIENGCFIIAPCAVGPIPGGGESYGHSLIIDPWGRVLADGGEDQGFIQATIDLSQARRVRSKIPSLTHDRAYSLQSAEMTERYQDL